jgi:hypothetical protein
VTQNRSAFPLLALTIASLGETGGNAYEALDLAHEMNRPRQPAIKIAEGSASVGDLRGSLRRRNLGQRPLNSIHFFANHPDGLLIARIGDGLDCFYRVTNLVVAIPNEVDSLGGLHAVLVNPPDQLRGHPGEREPEQHLDWKTISRSIEIAERESIHGLAKTQRREYYSHSN